MDGWLAAVSPTISLTLARLCGEVACSRQSRETTEKAYFLVTCTAFDREACLKTHGNTPLVEGNGVS